MKSSSTQTIKIEFPCCLFVLYFESIDKDFFLYKLDFQRSGFEVQIQVSKGFLYTSRLFLSLARVA